MNISRKYNIISGDFVDVDEDEAIVADFQDARTVLMVGLDHVSGEAVLYAECLNKLLSVRERLRLPSSRFVWMCAEAATADTDIRFYESGLAERFEESAEKDPEKFFEEDGQLLQNRTTLAKNVCETVHNLAENKTQKKRARRGK